MGAGDRVGVGGFVGGTEVFVAVGKGTGVAGGVGFGSFVAFLLTVAVGLPGFGLGVGETCSAGVELGGTGVRVGEANVGLGTTDVGSGGAIVAGGGGALFSACPLAGATVDVAVLDGVAVGRTASAFLVEAGVCVAFAVAVALGRFVMVADGLGVAVETGCQSGSSVGSMVLRGGRVGPTIGVTIATTVEGGCMVGDGVTVQVTVTVGDDKAVAVGWVAPRSGLKGDAK